MNSFPLVYMSSSVEWSQDGRQSLPFIPVDCSLDTLDFYTVLYTHVFSKSSGNRNAQNNLCHTQTWPTPSRRLEPRAQEVTSGHRHRRDKLHRQVTAERWFRDTRALHEEQPSLDVHSGKERSEKRRKVTLTMGIFNSCQCHLVKQGQLKDKDDNNIHNYVSKTHRLFHF